MTATTQSVDSLAGALTKYVLPVGSHRASTWRSSAVGAECAFEFGNVGLGLRFRAPVAGPEQEMVDDVLDTLRADVGRGRRLTVFCQPSLDSGFPDVVGVVWRPTVARTWAEEREQLQAAHLRLLHALANMGWTDIEFLEGVFRCRLGRTLDLLDDLGLVVRTAKRCRARSLSSIFAVDHIIAIEAKMAWWQRAVEQAGANVWFSSESHALIPAIPTSEALLETARRFQVGVLAFDASRPTALCDAPQRPVPLSYGSWLFNEWVWRIARRRGEL